MIRGKADLKNYLLGDKCRYTIIGYNVQIAVSVKVIGKMTVGDNVIVGPNRKL